MARKKIAVFTATITVYDEVEDGKEAPEFSETNTAVAGAIEVGIEDQLGFDSNAEVTRTDK